jgi:FkbH-like protein
VQLNCIKTLKSLLSANAPEFWDYLSNYSRTERDFEGLFLLSSLRKKAHAAKLGNPSLSPEKIRLAILGGYSFYPLHEIIQHFTEMSGIACEVWLGDYDNYISEILDENSRLYAFGPEIVLLMPSEQRCRYPGSLSDSNQVQRIEAEKVVSSLSDLVKKIHGKSRAEILLSNFMLPARHDPGPYRSRTLGSDWTFRKFVNMELGLNAPPYLHICDLEFLANRFGGIQARDDRAWFESKQPCSSALMAEFAREAAHMIVSLRMPPKKVLVLDLDNTLWGGVMAEDGLDGIELGDTSPRGEAFKAFQKYILCLKQRGVLLAVCSKNDHVKAKEVFDKHPEMCLRMADIVSFKANWEPKSDNIRQMAAELNLGLDSFVFVDDNPAEIEIVRQFAPQVTTILLDSDPANYLGQLQDCRLFEPRNLTAEDAGRTGQYLAEAHRKSMESQAVDMDSYLESLQMEAVIKEFNSTDAPRLAQLINKSNQFNLTTRRRTEAEVTEIMNDQNYVGYSLRLRDRFGDHGLVSVLIGRLSGPVMMIDTWLMSCRVLKRQVEAEMLNEIVRLALSRNCARLQGTYLPTAKNEMVRDFYARMSFSLTSENETRRDFELMTKDFKPQLTRIKIVRRAYEPG